MAATRPSESTHTRRVHECPRAEKCICSAIRSLRLCVSASLRRVSKSPWREYPQVHRIAHRLIAGAIGMQASPAPPMVLFGTNSARRPPVVGSTRRGVEVGDGVEEAARADERIDRLSPRIGVRCSGVAVGRRRWSDGRADDLDAPFARRACTHSFIPAMTASAERPRRCR